MKRLLILLLLALLSLYAFNQTIDIAKSTSISNYLAIIVLGDGEFACSSNRCYDLMSYYKKSDGTRLYEILYLSTDLQKTPNANLTANKENLKWALTSWLKEKSTPDTQVWIWIFSHGQGLHHQPKHTMVSEEKWTLDASYRWLAEINSDEGPEITEYLIGVDVDGDVIKSNTTWVGIDEALKLSSSNEEIVRDDELKEWLDGVSYRRMVICLSMCVIEISENNTNSCYCGGFIDDLSGPRRIIITCTNETYYGIANWTTGMSFFYEQFMNALDIRKPAFWDADIDGDSLPSVWEAYLYARERDMARIAVRNPSGVIEQDPWYPILGWLCQWFDESPWLDDCGDGFPTFINLSDKMSNTYFGTGCHKNDNELAKHTWLFALPYSQCREDINDDFKVDLTDVYTVSVAFGSYCNPDIHDCHPEWNPIADVVADNKVDLKDYFAIIKKFGWQG